MDRGADRRSGMRHMLQALGSVGVLAAFGHAQVPQSRGWHITSLDLEAVVVPEMRLLTVSGVVRLRSAGGGTAGPVLAFGPGGVTFDSARVSVPATLGYSAARDSLLIQLGGAGAREVAITFFGQTSKDL